MHPFVLACKLRGLACACDLPPPRARAKMHLRPHKANERQTFIQNIAWERPQGRRDKPKAAGVRRWSGESGDLFFVTSRKKAACPLCQGKFRPTWARDAMGTTPQDSTMPCKHTKVRAPTAPPPRLPGLKVWKRPMCALKANSSGAPHPTAAHPEVCGNCAARWARASTLPARLLVSPPMPATHVH